MHPARTRLTVEAGALLFLLVLILLAAPAVQGQRRPQQPSPGADTRDRYRNPRETDISLGLDVDPRDVPDIPPTEPAQSLATFRSEYRNSAFAGVAGNNLVHHGTISPDGVGFWARRVAGEMEQEFLASTDIWFRPVALAVRPPFAAPQALPQSAIARMQALEQSMMPEGLEEGLSLQDMADLLQVISGS